MKTQPVNTSLMEINPTQDYSDRPSCLKAIYRQLFKENRNFDFFHNSTLDSLFLAGELTTRDMICELLCSEMYRDYILEVNSNYHFISLCFERVLGRPPEDQEKYQWSSFLATEGLRAFAEKLTGSDEYIAAFGDNIVPSRRSLKLFSSDQNLPALPKEQSIQRYGGEGNTNQYRPHYYGSILRWENGQPPRLVRQIFAVIAVASAIEVIRIFLTVAIAAFKTGSF
ncbi:MAG: phycobilisome Linker polypeptide [Okeania sp. SIO3B5]|uniref:phycobilisome rod-core linker polypeptide n=1 Tax=Okeania sp. SIO3B5 TaxID=2607811 RepID=UPI001400500F|nr:phycobilisome rod-core linker polypeptide [Okeania sp. SIO3B5]NEO56319.1 phycobilisome Linker polypeptide [Okeania sp. SIO3B5]